MTRRAISGLLAATVALSLSLPAAAAGQGVLYSQLDSPGSTSVASDEYYSGSGVESYDDQAADDFTVPPGETWQPFRVRVQGTYPVSTPQSFASVFLYADSAGLPGDQIWTQHGTPANAGPNYSIPLTATPMLAPGTYWISVQQFDAGGSTSWKWGDRTTQAGSAAVWRQPGNGSFLDCIDWKVRGNCVSTTASEPDQLFALDGDVGPYPPLPPPPGPSLPPPADFTFGHLQRNTKNGTAKLTVEVPAAGHLKLTGKGLVAQQKMVQGFGPVKLLIKPQGGAKRKLDKTGKVTLRAKITFTSSESGDAATHTKTITLHEH